MARTWNLTLTPADGTREVIRGIADEDMVHMLAALVRGEELPTRVAAAPARDELAETREPVAA